MAEYEYNSSPPSTNYDFDVGRVRKHTIYLTALGKPCQYINILDEDAFITPSGSEETELSSDESVSSIDSSKRSIAIPPISSNDVIKIKEEKLSDTEEASKSKTKSKSPTKQVRPKPKKFPVVEYTDSEDSDDHKPKSYRKNYLKDSEENRSKTRRKKHSSDSDENRSRPYRKKNSDEDRSDSRRKRYSDDSEEDLPKSYRKEKPVKREETEEPEYKYAPGLVVAFGNYHCQVCDIVVNSEVTYQTHLQGKKHQKALKAKTVPDIVFQSLNEPRKLPPRVQTPVVYPPVAYPTVAPVKKLRRTKLNAESLIQKVAEDYRDGPLPGLESVVEIRPPIDGVRDIAYVCELCDAQCVPNSIMKHLTGFKHYLRCLEKVDPKLYERHLYTPKKQIEGKVRKVLLDYEKYHGRGKIHVEREIAEEYQHRDEPGPSWRDDGPPPPVAPNYNDDDEVQLVSAVGYLDTSMSDFYCKACDAHMNNQAMWESHVRGKRHLKNIKKVPGESTSKIKSVHCPDETAQLMRIINELDEKDEYGNDIVIVGLGFLKETQGEGGNLYNCYLCGACTSSYDIIDHLNQTKHKIKYLEEMNLKGCPNGIDQVKAFSGFSAYSKECMINDECRKSLDRYGEGKVAVYRSKNMFTPSFGSRL